MSYILEALKKSQQERELGQVPRLQAATLEPPSSAGGGHPWVYLALLLALTAVAIALYAAVQGAASVPGQPSPAPLTEAAEPASRAQEPSPQPPRELSVPPMAPAAAGVAPSGANSERVAATPRGTAPTAAPRSDLDGVNAGARPALEPPAQPPAEPQVLVVPAAPKPGQPLPRGAEELRRAALGESSDVPSPGAVSAPPAAAPAVVSTSDYTPVPDDLIADIEAFKQRVSGDAPTADAGPRPTSRGAPQPVRPEPLRAATQESLPPPASAALRNRLPPFSMSVHIYDAEPARRFVYINGRKLKERQKSREGLRIEQIVAEGAVLSYDGERFFHPR